MFALGGKLRRRQVDIFGVNHRRPVRLFLDHNAGQILGPALPERAHFGALRDLVTAGADPLLLVRIDAERGRRALAELLHLLRLAAVGPYLAGVYPFIGVGVAACHQWREFFPIDRVNNALKGIAAGRAVIDADGAFLDAVRVGQRVFQFRLENPVRFLIVGPIVSGPGRDRASAVDPDDERHIALFGVRLVEKTNA